jgi:hypothetical protein
MPRLNASLLAVCFALGLSAAAHAADAPWNSPDAKIDYYDAAGFTVGLQDSSQTLVALQPKGQGGFDFAPSGRFTQRLKDGYYRVGDIDLRVRAAGAETWSDYSSAFKRTPVKALKIKGVLAAADITPSLDGIPLTVRRVWAVDRGQLVLRFTLSNRGGTAVEIGGLGLPMIFDNIIADRTLEQAHEQASFYDPYVGRDAGYLQVTRLNGHGPALLVLPEKNTPFELYKPILDKTNREDRSPVIYNDPMRRGMVFEGFYDWMVASKGFADTDWKGVEQWNETSSLILKPGETRTIGLRFVLSPSIRAIEDTLAANERPVAIGVPGYLVPTDMPADLFLKSPSPVKTIKVYPAGTLDIAEAPPAKGWQRYTLTGKTDGRARVTITYADGSVQTVHYLVTKPESQVVADMGRFLTTKQWFDDPNDLFHRGPSIMTYDRDEKKIVTDDPRVWVSGLSDEGGAGSWLAAAMKELDNPTPDEMARVETFANQTLWGKIQVSEGEHQYGVRKSIFYYDPTNMPAGTYDPKKDWSTWTSWSKEGADDLGRSFNYVHAAAAWWSLYRVARYHDGLATQGTWQTYLKRTVGTTEAMMRDAPYYTQFGQMEGNVFVAILTDLKREGWNDDANAIETLMKGRADQWAKEPYPFGSEMPWDSTGQSEVYDWMKYFHHDDKALATREVILAYDPAIPHWGYNGSARRFWDFLYAGKQSRIERQLHHYGSSNNAIPLFESYRDDPSDFHLLQVAYGGLMGSLTNVDGDGFGSAAFHSFPDAMHFDAISGDYGMSFFAHAYSVASYLVDHPRFGWIGFGGTVETRNGRVVMAPKDSARARVFVAPAGLWLTLDAGKVQDVAYDPKSGRVELTLDPADGHTPTAYVNFAVTTAKGRAYKLVSNVTRDKGAWAVPLAATPTTIVLAPQ